MQIVMFKRNFSTRIRSGFKSIKYEMMIIIEGEWLKKESTLLKINIGKIGVGVNEKSSLDHGDQF